MKKSTVVFTLFLLLISLNFATSPKSPLHEYNYSGYLKADSVYSKENFAIQLFGKYQNSNNYMPLIGNNNEMDIPVFITDSTGKFYLTVTDYIKYDSLKVGVVHPANSPIFSRAYSINESSYSEHYEPTINPMDKSGCSCSSEPTSTRLGKRIYTQLGIWVDIKSLDLD